MIQSKKNLVLSFDYEPAQKSIIRFYMHNNLDKDENSLFAEKRIDAVVTECIILMESIFLDAKS